MGSRQSVTEAVAEITGLEPVAVHGLSTSVWEVELADGDLVVVKRTDGAEAEAAGLAWLAESGTVPVPGVRGHDSRWLVIEQIEPGHASSEAAERFGRQLAALHSSGANAFGEAPPGAPAEGTIGSAAMDYASEASWPRWYAEHRIAPYLARATALTSAEKAVIEQVRDRIEELAGPAEPPARLHGDLWSGNVHWAAGGRVWLIDPAAHGGHRETDLAMLHLFGCPHLDRVLLGYVAESPLADGWQRRIPLHQLFPLLVHVELFGRTYAHQAVTAARQALRL